MYRSSKQFKFSAEFYDEFDDEIHDEIYDKSKFLILGVVGKESTCEALRE